MVVRKEKDQWEEIDQLSRSYNFTWKIENNIIKITVIDKNVRWHKGGEHKFELFGKPSRSQMDYTADGFKLFDELIIYQLGALLRVDQEKAKKFIERYKIRY